MFSTALSLATLTVGAAIVIFHKLPRKVRRFISKHSLLTDILCLFATYQLLGGTITALLAAGVVSLIVSGLLHVVNHEQEFLYLYDLRDYIKNKIKSAKETLSVYGEQYRQKQLSMPNT